jgi:hypothetical protein
MVIIVTDMLPETGVVGVGWAVGGTGADVGPSASCLGVAVGSGVDDGTIHTQFVC